MVANDFVRIFVEWCANADLCINLNTLCRWITNRADAVAIIRSWASFDYDASALVAEIDQTGAVDLTRDLYNWFVQSARTFSTTNGI